MLPRAMETIQSHSGSGYRHCDDDELLHEHPRGGEGKRPLTRRQRRQAVLAERRRVVSCFTECVSDFHAGLQTMF